MEGGFGCFGALFEAPVVKVKPFEEEELDFFLGLDGDFVKEPEEGLSGYLQKEQIIFSMLREKKQRELVFNEDGFFETLSAAAMRKHPEARPRYEYVKKVVTRDIIVPMLNEIKKSGACTRMRSRCWRPYRKDVISGIRWGSRSAHHPARSIRCSLTER